MTLAEFTNSKDIVVLDLSKQLKVPGLYSDQADQAESIKFLNDFARIVSADVSWLENTYLEYIPTQVFTEYVRHVGHEKYGIKGIIYNSAKSSSSRNVALFFLNDECKNADELKKGDDVLVLRNWTKFTLEKTKAS